MKTLTTLLLTLLMIGANAQDTTYNTRTYQVRHDTAITTHIAQQIIHYADSVITVHGGVMKMLKNKVFTNSTGDKTQTIPLYDTIPAHDSTFNCVNCAVHDTTVTDIIITPPATNDVIYGVFILNNPQTPIASRIHQAKSIHHYSTAMRYNYDRGDDHYYVKQIQDSGLLCVMTYNNRPVQDVAFFPVGDELTASMVTLDSLLTITTPDLLSIENEEGHQEYHKGTVYDYLNELNAAVVVSHAHHVPICNGGLTQGVVFALRKWYADRGETDSVTFLNTALSLNPHNTSYSLQQEDWYIPLLAGIAASNVDYINYHWYEPPRTDTFPTTTSKVLGPLINYLRIITGKDVLTNESGCRNHSTALLKEMFHEITNGHSKWGIYYLGVGELAQPNEEGFKEFLNELP
jgi:hypothetical protein